MYDLSFITHALSDLLSGALQTSPLYGGGMPPFSFAISNQHPSDAPDSSGADCDINLYLFHVSEDRTLRNQFWSQKSISNQPPGPARQPVAFEPLCLDLYYLLTAHSQTNYQYEQAAMSIAMRAFHEYAKVELATPTWDGSQPVSDVTLTLEAPTWEELSRLWQALELPMRLTAQYKVSVAMLMPEGGLLNPDIVQDYVLMSGPAPASDGVTAELFGTSRTVAYQAPGGARSYEQTPASTAPAAGQEFTLRGAFNQTTDLVQLITTAPDGTQSEQDITGWVVPLVHPYPTPPQAGFPIRLRPPTAPGACPPPGRYLLALTRPAEPGWRSNTVPLSIAAWIDPAGGPLLTAGGGGTYSFTAVGVPAAGAELRLGTVQLRQVGGAPSAGEWAQAGATISFTPPPIPAGTYAIRLRAADIEADPALWAVVT
jgi:hypothetical protein